MTVGILKEIKEIENRVAMTPAGVELMSTHGHTVIVEASAGTSSGFSDYMYTNSGAIIVKINEEVYKRSDVEALLELTLLK